MKINPIKSICLLSSILFLGACTQGANSKEQSSSIETTENGVPQNFVAIPTKTDETKMIYGIYPQTEVKDKELISSLKKEVGGNKDSAYSNWTFYENYYYAHLDKNGVKTWYKCEPIVWDIIEENEGTYTLLSNILLDNVQFNSDDSINKLTDLSINPNSYANSEIRTWLNSEFYHYAFQGKEEYIIDTTIKEGSEEINDKIYLFSEEEYSNSTLGFNSDNNRKCPCSDYLLGKGTDDFSLDDSTSTYNTYWTRTPSPNLSKSVRAIKGDGAFADYRVLGAYIGVRPAIRIKL